MHRYTRREIQTRVDCLHDLTQHVAAGAITRDQKILVATDALAEMFGYSPWELEHKMTINDLVAVPNHRNLVEQAVAENDENTKRAMKGVGGLHKDGTQFNVSVELEFNVTVNGQNCTAFVVVRRSDEQ